MAKGLRGMASGSARDKAERDDLQQQLAASKGFVFLAADDVKDRGIERRGEAIETVVFYRMPGEHDSRYRFFLNARDEVADFTSAVVD
jgi:hypothetical protein